MLTFAPALTALAATLAVSTTPTPPAQYPIGVTRCDVVESAPVLPADAAFPQSYGSTLEISFVHHAAIAAKVVRILVSYAGGTQTIVDRGTFSQNVAIDHAFDPRTAAFGGGGAQCTVSSVQFADGTTWQNG